jgi:hypothetical protein
MKRYLNVCAVVFVVAMATMTCFADGPSVCSPITDIGASGYPTPGWPSTQGIPADYLAGTGVCSFGTTSFASANHCTDSAGQEAELFPAETVVSVPDGGWATWSAPPYSESSTPWGVATYESSNPSQLKIDLAKAAMVLGFELEPNAFATNLVTANFFGAAGPGAPLLSITLAVDGSSGATLFGAQCDVSILGVLIESSAAAEGFAIANLRSNSMVGTAAPKVPGAPAPVPPGLTKNH